VKFNRTEITCKDERYIFLNSDIWKDYCFICFMSFQLSNKQNMPSASNMAVSVVAVTHDKKKKDQTTFRSPIAIYFLHLQKSKA
jgi:hypothetical protein